MSVESNVVHAALGRIHNSKVKFYLTGSRFFETYQPSSDWDFFTKNSRQTAQLLKSWGFVEVPKPDSNYVDRNTAKVFQYTRGVNIHVQLVDDVRKKQRIQTVMLKHGLWSIVPKQYASAVWSFAYDLVS